MDVKDVYFFPGDYFMTYIRKMTSYKERTRIRLIDVSVTKTEIQNKTGLKDVIFWE